MKGPILFRMRNNDERPQRFGALIAQLMAERDIKSQAEFARRTGLQNSTVSRWLSGEGTPDPKLLARVAERLTVVAEEEEAVYSALMEAAGHISSGGEKKTRTMDPLARDLALMLGEHSPLSESERDLLAKLVGKIVDSFR